MHSHLFKRNYELIQILDIQRARESHRLRRCIYEIRVNRFNSSTDPSFLFFSLFFNFCGKLQNFYRKQIFRRKVKIQTF